MLTTWRVYRIEVEEVDAGWLMTTYNIFGNEIQTLVYTSQSHLNEKVRQYQRIEPRCVFEGIRK